MFRVASAGVFLLALSSPSSAYQIRALDAGVLWSNSGSTASFDAVSPTSYGATTATGSFTERGINFSGGGVVMKNGPGGTGSSLGLYAEPFHDTTNYMAVLGNGEEVLQFSSYKTDFGLYWGSMDTFNSISFSDGMGNTAFFSGADLVGVGLVPNGDQKSDASNRYVEFSGLGRFDTVTLRSGGNSFEFDNISASSGSDVAARHVDGAPAPLAGTGLMSLVAVGGIVLFGRLRRFTPL